MTGRDRDAERCRLATQTIIEAIGSVGPESIDGAVARLLARLAVSEELLKGSRDDYARVLAKYVGLKAGIRAALEQ